MKYLIVLACLLAVVVAAADDKNSKEVEASPTELGVTDQDAAEDYYNGWYGRGHYYNPYGYNRYNGYYRGYYGHGYWRHRRSVDEQPEAADQDTQAHDYYPYWGYRGGYYRYSGYPSYYHSRYPSSYSYSHRYY